MSESLMNADMEKSHTLHFINFSSITVRQMDTFPQPLPVRRSLDIITNVTGKLPCTSTMVHLIIPFIEVVSIVDPLNQVPKVFLSNKESCDPSSTC